MQPSKQERRRDGLGAGGQDFWEDGKLEEEDPALVVVETNNFFGIAISRWLHKQRVKTSSISIFTRNMGEKFSKEEIYFPGGPQARESYRD